MRLNKLSISHEKETYILQKMILHCHIYLKTSYCGQGLQAEFDCIDEHLSITYINFSEVFPQKWFALHLSS